VTTIYQGYDVHAYTPHMRELVATHRETFLGPVPAATFEALLGELETRYGPQPAYANLREVYREGHILDPDLPTINVARILQVVWTNLQDKPDPSAYEHFRETLAHIDKTCVQGISHRLLMDFFAFCT